MIKANSKLSARLEAIVSALPIFPGARVLEIGCGPGAAAREIIYRFSDVHVLAIDRSPKAIQQAIYSSAAEIKTGRLQFRQIAIEQFSLQPGEKPYDMAFAIRVGALDGRHPKIGKIAFPKIALALTEEGKLFIDRGNPLLEIPLNKYR